MKLQAELQPTIDRMKRIADKIPPYAEQLKINGGYKDFTMRLAWDCMNAVYTSVEICDFYKKYSCTDEHITTLAKAALKEVY